MVFIEIRGERLPSEAIKRVAITRQPENPHGGNALFAETPNVPSQSQAPTRMTYQLSVHSRPAASQPLETKRSNPPRRTVKMATLHEFYAKQHTVKEPTLERIRSGCFGKRSTSNRFNAIKPLRSNPLDEPYRERAPARGIGLGQSKVERICLVSCRPARGPCLPRMARHAEAASETPIKRSPCRKL